MKFFPFFLFLILSISNPNKYIDNSTDIQKLNYLIDKSINISNSAINSVNNILITFSAILILVTVWITCYINHKYKQIIKIKKDNIKSKKDIIELQKSIEIAKNDVLKINKDLNEHPQKFYQKSKDEELKEIIKILKEKPVEIYNYSGDFNLTYSYNFYEPFKEILLNLSNNIDGYFMVIEKYIDILLFKYPEKFYFDNFNDKLDSYIKSRLPDIFLKIPYDSDIFNILKKIKNKSIEENKSIDKNIIEILNNKRFFNDIKNKEKLNKILNTNNVKEP